MNSNSRRQRQAKPHLNIRIVIEFTLATILYSTINQESIIFYYCIFIFFFCKLIKKKGF